MPDRPGAIEVATWIGEAYWGRGYATEATHAIIDRAFTETGISVLWCSNRVSNSRARRVIEKCGFQFRETGMVRSPASFGAVPVERFVLERRNWTSLKSWGAAVAEKGDAPHSNAA
jgi:RimJ/RimL family protein N-acetyltransferase